MSYLVILHFRMMNTLEGDIYKIHSGLDVLAILWVHFRIKGI